MKSDKIAQNLGFQLRHLRERNNYTQKFLADKANLATKHYQEIEYGRRNCRIDTLNKILSVYNLDFFNFFENYIIKIFYQDGLNAFSTLIDNQSFVYHKINTQGIFSEVQLPKNCSWSATSDELKDKVFFWDTLESEIERAFVKYTFIFLIKNQPTPIPWVSQYIVNGNSVRLKSYWRYWKADDGQLLGLEVILFNI